jgi:hypothetical protein
MSEGIRRRQIVENMAITEVVSEYVPRHGDGASLRSLCPFHDDRLYTFRLDPGMKSFMWSPTAHHRLSDATAAITKAGHRIRARLDEMPARS